MTAFVLVHGTIAGIELLRPIKDAPFDLGALCLKGPTSPAVWNSVLAY